MMRMLLFVATILGLMAVVSVANAADSVSGGEPATVVDAPSTVTVAPTQLFCADGNDPCAKIAALERKLAAIQGQRCGAITTKNIGDANSVEPAKRNRCEHIRWLAGQIDTLAAAYRAGDRGLDDKIVALTERVDELEKLGGRVGALEADVNGMRRVSLGACLGGNLSLVPMPADVVSVQSRSAVPVGFGDACMYVRLGGAGSGQGYAKLFGGAGLGSGPSVNAFGGVAAGSSLSDHLLFGGRFQVANQAYLVGPTGYTAQNNFVLAGGEVSWRLTPVDSRAEVVLTGYVLGGVASGQHAYLPNAKFGPAGTVGATLEIGLGSIRF